MFLQIPEIRDGRIEYRAHPFWGQKYCPLHERDGTPRCCSCERMEVGTDSHSEIVLHFTIIHLSPRFVIFFT